ncbi:MAG TPA: ABC transporter substrate-binding protein [Methylomirabilota bacterium]|jgi:peptide/nickel transport system substrate-binding protein|nr:ABC transporter substrate-binding protein [Methylomirabilota bacterium]
MIRFLLILFVFAVAHPLAAQEQPRVGGVLKAAMIGEPPSLDLHWTTAVITQQIAWHVYETLFTYDRDFNPIPMLAESADVADGGRRVTIALRRGVRFHNGKEMTSADVVASLKRWGARATPAKPVWKSVEAVEAKDPYTVVIHLKEPSGSLIPALARPNNGAAIYPKEVVERAGADGQIAEFVGTGPFRFVEHRPDRHIKVARFKEYAARAEAPNGYGGRRTAYVDEILFIPVPDVPVRIAGVETGEYHYAISLKGDLYERIKALPGVEPVILKPYGWATAVLNTKQGAMADKRFRQAFLAALDMEPIMAAGFGHPAFYRLDQSVHYREQPWYSTVGGDQYNQKNPEKARRLLREAGYAGQPIRWITTKEYEWMYKNALVAKQQLEAVGFRIDLQVLDWATLVQRRNKPELYDVFSTGFSFNHDPALATALQCSWPGWWCHPEKEKLLEAMAREHDTKKRRELMDRIQAIFYDDVPRIKFGDYFQLEAKRKELRGFQPTPELFFWNTWLAH